MSERLTTDLIALVGEIAFVRLTQVFGGRRLYMPHKVGAEHEIAQAVGTEAARRLSERLAPAVIRVPLAREVRARYYRAAGRSHGEIASLLGITETAVDKMFTRMQSPPVKGSASSAQHSLFPDDK